MAIARPASRKQRLLDELQGTIIQRFPDARFRVAPVPDVRGVTGVWTYTSADPSDVRDLIRDREVEIMLDEKLHILTIILPIEAYDD